MTNQKYKHDFYRMTSIEVGSDSDSTIKASSPSFQLNNYYANFSPVNSPNSTPTDCPNQKIGWSRVKCPKNKSCLNKKTSGFNSISDPNFKGNLTTEHVHAYQNRFDEASTTSNRDDQRIYEQRIAVATVSDVELKNSHSKSKRKANNRCKPVNRHAEDQLGHVVQTDGSETKDNCDKIQQLNELKHLQETSRNDHDQNEENSCNRVSSKEMDFDENCSTASITAEFNTRDRQQNVNPIVNNDDDELCQGPIRDFQNHEDYKIDYNEDHGDYFYKDVEKFIDDSSDYVEITNNLKRFEKKTPARSRGCFKDEVNEEGRRSFTDPHLIAGLFDVDNDRHCIACNNNEARKSASNLDYKYPSSKDIDRIESDQKHFETNFGESSDQDSDSSDVLSENNYEESFYSERSSANRLNKNNKSDTTGRLKTGECKIVLTSSAEDDIIDRWDDYQDELYPSDSEMSEEKLDPSSIQEWDHVGFEDINITNASDTDVDEIFQLFDQSRRGLRLACKSLARLRKNRNSKGLKEIEATCSTNIDCLNSVGAATRQRDVLNFDSNEGDILPHLTDLIANWTGLYEEVMTMKETNTTGFNYSSEILPHVLSTSLSTKKKCGTKKECYGQRESEFYSESLTSEESNSDLQCDVNQDKNKARDFQCDMNKDKHSNCIKDRGVEHSDNNEDLGIRVKDFSDKMKANKRLNCLNTAITSVHKDASQIEHESSQHVDLKLSDGGVKNITRPSRQNPASKIPNKANYTREQKKNKPKQISKVKRYEPDQSTDLIDGTKIEDIEAYELENGNQERDAGRNYYSNNWQDAKKLPGRTKIKTSQQNNYGQGESKINAISNSSQITNTVQEPNGATSVIEPVFRYMEMEMEIEGSNDTRPINLTPTNNNFELGLKINLTNDIDTKTAIKNPIGLRINAKKPKVNEKVMLENNKQENKDASMKIKSRQKIDGSGELITIVTSDDEDFSRNNPSKGSNFSQIKIDGDQLENTLQFRLVKNRKKKKVPTATLR